MTKDSTLTEAKITDAENALQRLTAWARITDEASENALARVKALEAENAALKAQVTPIAPKAGDRLVNEDGRVVTLTTSTSTGWRFTMKGEMDGQFLGTGGPIDDALAGRNGWRHEVAEVKSAFASKWCDMPTYSYRRAGEELLVCEGGTYWKSFLFGPQRAPPLRDGATRDEAKAILDAAVATKKAPRYTVKETSAGDGWCVMRDGLVYSNGTMMRTDAERFAAALEAAEGKP